MKRDIVALFGQGFDRFVCCVGNSFFKYAKLTGVSMKHYVTAGKSLTFQGP